MTEDRKTRIGSAGDDTLTGGRDNDILDGGDGDDILRGRKGNDTLTGGAGDDTLGGGKGNDTLASGAGDDTLTGGRGTDIFVFEAGDGHDTITDFDAGDSIRLDGVAGGFASLVIEQDGSHTVIRYGDGDTIRLSGVTADSLGADDFLFPHAGIAPPESGGGAAASHTLAQGAPPDDNNDGGNPNDNNNGGEDDGDSDDTAPDTSGDEPIEVEVCGVTLNGGAGFDALFGTQCDDTIYGKSGDDKLYGRKGDDKLYGGDGDDILRGNAGDDQIRGGDGDDFLSGRNGDDRLEGDRGNDFLSGGLGDDTLRGGEGFDRFSFFAEGYYSQWEMEDGGNDTILDFEDGTDGILFHSVDGKLGFDDLTISQSDSGAVITWSQGTITLRGIQASQLTAADFDFIEPHDHFIYDTSGDDTLRSRADHDAFGFKGGGDDTILGFEDGTDRIDFYSPDSEFGFDDLEIRDSDSGAVITWSLGTITLVGIQASQLTAADFDFIG